MDVRGFGLSQQAGFGGAELDRFGARGGENEIEALDRFSATPALFIPFEVVAALGVVFVLAGDPDVIADDSSIALDDAGERPATVDLDHLDDVDAIGILPGSGHCPEASLRSALDK